MPCNIIFWHKYMFRGFMSANKLKFHKLFLVSVALNGTQISFIIWHITFTKLFNYNNTKCINVNWIIYWSKNYHSIQLEAFKKVGEREERTSLNPIEFQETMMIMCFILFYRIHNENIILLNVHTSTPFWN